MNVFTFHYVSIKSRLHTLRDVGKSLFTFHYVSIKSGVTGGGAGAGMAYLHSTMYLLNLDAVRFSTT